MKTYQKYIVFLAIKLYNLSIKFNKTRYVMFIACYYYLRNRQIIFLIRYLFSVLYII